MRNGCNELEFLYLFILQIYIAREESTVGEKQRGGTCQAMKVCSAED